MTSEPTSATAETTTAAEGGWELFAHDADIGVREQFLSFNGVFSKPLPHPM